MTNETSWAIDVTHSEIAFKVKHLMIANVSGSFKGYDTDIKTNGAEKRNRKK
ncbi:MAG TPA: YceI family protein [Bacteroidia bacterium]|nr:YceI family protein [Bacteroidia bacterium]